MTDKLKEIKELSYTPKCAWHRFKDDEMVFKYAQGYIAYLNECKTERIYVQKCVEQAKKAGFVPIESVTALKSGDRVYSVNRGKGLVLAVIGNDGTLNGCNIVGAHIDAPRLDLKQNPLFEQGAAAFLKTHYYGGIKKYQWTTIPLALYGVVYKTDGTMVNICLGDAKDDITFTITDLLPHLSGEQMKKTLADGIEGESLNAITGSIPIDDKETKSAVKLNILRLIHERYGITERDFQNAELQFVPAMCAKTVGLDQSMVGGYGQDDRVCAYTAHTAIFDVNKPKHTAVCMLVDKEEIGSAGATGINGRFYENTLAKLIQLETGKCDFLDIRTSLSKSNCLSADVTCGVDPYYPTVQEKNNSAKLSYGVAITKYTGARGKSGANDASPEFLAKLAAMLDKHSIVYQTGELGKIDVGGGGTIARYLAEMDIETVDMGVPLLSMHSPFELASKVDIYMTYLAYKAFMAEFPY